MQKTAVGVMLAGFVLAFFSIEAFGMDLLIDAVGWLLVFNAARALAVWDKGFKPASWLALGLVGVSALQLFFMAGALALVLGVLRVAGQAALFLLLAGGFARLFAAGGQKRLAPVARAVFWLGAACCAAMLLPASVPAGLSLAAAVLLTCSQIFMVFLLFFACILPGSLLY